MKVITIIALMQYATLSFANSNLKYRTDFGKCPAKTVGDLAIELINHFDKTGSLYDLKKYIEKNGLEKKFFLSKKIFQNFP